MSPCPTSWRFLTPDQWLARSDRDSAYRVAQELAQQAWATRTPLRELVAADPRAGGLDLDEVFDPAAFTRHAREIVARLDAIA